MVSGAIDSTSVTRSAFCFSMPFPDWRSPMPVARSHEGASLLDVLDRVLDKGIVIDAWVRVALAGIDLVTVEARVVIASIETYVLHSDALGRVAATLAPTPKVSPRLAVLRRRRAGTA
jgi:hypothetical protein